VQLALSGVIFCLDFGPFFISSWFLVRCFFFYLFSMTKELIYMGPLQRVSYVVFT
jgi:hypothetical protein